MPPLQRPHITCISKVIRRSFSALVGAAFAGWSLEVVGQPDLIVGAESCRSEACGQFYTEAQGEGGIPSD
jgi:hypothetical protein